MDKIQHLKNMMENQGAMLDRLAGHKKLTKDDRAAILSFYLEVSIVMSELWKEIPE